MAERCQLFVIVALGESTLVTGADVGAVPASARTVAAFAVAGRVTLWWLYVDRAEEAARRVIAAASDPGRLALSASTSFHIPTVAGIIAAAATDELTIAHPGEGATIAPMALILGGPARTLLGHVPFKWAVWGHLARPRLVAIGAQIALLPVATVSSRLVLLIAATLVLVGLAQRDVRAEMAGDGTTRGDRAFAPPLPVARGEAESRLTGCTGWWGGVMTHQAGDGQRGQSGARRRSLSCRTRRRIRAARIRYRGAVDVERGPRPLARSVQPSRTRSDDDGCAAADGSFVCWPSRFRDT